MAFLENIKRGITKNVLLLGAVSFFMDTSSEMIFSILPLFLMNVLHTAAPIIGLIEGIAESTASVLKFFSGWLSDKFGRRKLFLYMGYGFSTLLKPLFAVANSWPLVLFARFGDRVGKGLRGTARDALLADLSEKKYRGKVFGLHRSMDTAGAIAGPLIAASLLAYIGYRGIFWIAVIPAVLAVLTIFPIKVREKYREEGFDSKKISFSLKGFSRRYKTFLFVMALFSLANFSYAFFMLKANNIGVEPSLVVVMYLVYNIVYAVFAVPVGILSDKIGRKKVIITGYFIFVLMMLGFAFAENIIHAFILFAVYGISMSIFESVPKVFISDIVAQEKRGTALGIYNAVVGMIILPASLFAGLIWQYVNPAMPFFIGAGVSALALVLMVIV